MDKIAEEIKVAADVLEKASKLPPKTPNPKDDLVKALVVLGKDGILAKMDSLSDSEKNMIVELMPDIKKAVALEALEKGQKAVTMDEAETSAGYHKGKVYGGKPGYDGTGTVIEEDHASTKGDEKLVKPSAAKQQHQGDQSPEGRDENKIEDPTEEEKGIKKKKKKDKMKKSELFLEVCEFVQKGGNESEAVEHFQKSYDLDTLNVVGDMIKFAIAENNKRSEMDVECPMYKALDEMHKGGMSQDYMKGYGMAKGDFSEDSLNKMITHLLGGTQKDLEKAGTDEKAGGNLAGLTPNPEEKQVADKLEDLQSGTVRGDQSRPEALKVDAENVDAQKKVDAGMGGKVMQKSVNWAGENSLLSVERGGRNFHFSMNGAIDSSVGLLDALKKGADGHIQKAEGINAVIENGEDELSCNVIAKAAVKALDQQNVLMNAPTFDLETVASSMGISEEDQALLLKD